MTGVNALANLEVLVILTDNRIPAREVLKLDTLAKIFFYPYQHGRLENEDPFPRTLLVLCRVPIYSDE